MPPPESLATTMVSDSGRGSAGPMFSAPASCRKVRSPISASVRGGRISSACARSRASATPTAVATVPSMPAAPRPAWTSTPGNGSPAHDASRTGFDAPSTSCSPVRRLSATAAATCRPVSSSAVSPSTSRTADAPSSEAASHTSSHWSGHSPETSTAATTRLALALTSG